MGRKKKGITDNKYIDSLIDDIKPRKRRKLTRKQLITRLTLYGILWVVLLCSLFFAEPIEKGMNHTEFNFNPAIAQGEYKVHFIDVGQGDCTFIELPDDKTIMIDNGKPSAKNNILRYLDALNIKVIDYMILTHTDNDHIGNTPVLMEKYEIKTTFVPKVYSNYEKENNLIDKANSDWTLKDTRIWSKTMEAVYKEKCEIIRSFEGCEIKFDNDDNPENDQYNFKFYTPTKISYKDSNDYSPIIMGMLQGKKYIFTGDASVDGEQEFLDKHFSPEFYDCDVLKVGHHGSDTSTSKDFLNMVKPEIAVISCGVGNSYGHPCDVTMEKLNAVEGLKILRTDTMGSIVLNSQNDGIASGKISTQTGYNHVSDTYLEWKNFVIVGGVILLIGWVFVIHTGKDKKEKSSEKKTD